MTQLYWCRHKKVETISGEVFVVFSLFSVVFYCYFSRLPGIQQHPYCNVPDIIVHCRLITWYCFIDWLRSHMS